MLSSVVGPILQCLGESGVVGTDPSASVLSPLQLQALADSVVIPTPLASEGVGEPEEPV